MDSAADFGFRFAIDKDLDLLLGLEERFYAGEGYPFDIAAARRATLRLLREPERGRIWLAIHGEQLVGYVILTFAYSIEFHGLNAFVDELYMEPEARGLGLGTKALALAEAACVELGISYLHLEVERRKVDVQEMYRKHGFKDHDRFLMTKTLPLK